MEDLFEDVLNLKGVKGVLLLSFDGDIISKHFPIPVSKDPEKWDWESFVAALEGVKETELVFENSRIYIRRSDLGYLLVILDRQTPVAMLRLNCDILLPSLKPATSSKGIKRFFKKNR